MLCNSSNWIQIVNAFRTLHVITWECGSIYSWWNSLLLWWFGIGRSHVVVPCKKLEMLLLSSQPWLARPTTNWRQHKSPSRSLDRRIKMFNTYRQKHSRNRYLWINQGTLWCGCRCCVGLERSLRGCWVRLTTVLGSRLFLQKKFSLSLSFVLNNDTKQTSRCFEWSINLAVTRTFHFRLSPLHFCNQSAFVTTRTQQQSKHVVWRPNILQWCQIPRVRKTPTNSSLSTGTNGTKHIYFTSQKLTCWLQMQMAQPPRLVFRCHFQFDEKLKRNFMGFLWCWHTPGLSQLGQEKCVCSCHNNSNFVWQHSACPMKFTKNDSLLKDTPQAGLQDLIHLHTTCMEH